MYLLTRIEGKVDSGVYASVDDDGTAIVQFFIDKDDAVSYNIMLEALDQDIHVTEIDSDMQEKLCSVLGHAYTIVEPGEIVIPKVETLHHVEFESL
jgi:hypothetical protein